MRRWSKATTKDLIELKLPESTKLALSNVIYFKGLWETPFSSADVDLFHISKEESVTVKYLKEENYVVYGSRSLEYLSTSTFDGCIKHYTKPGWRQIFVLPKGDVGTQDFSITDSEILEAKGLTALENREIESVSLNVPQTELSFEQSFSRLIKNIPLNSNIVLGKLEEPEFDLLQMTKLINNTRGTEAAALTVYRAMDGGMGPIQVKLTLDKPYLSVIVDSNDVVVFRQLITGQDPTVFRRYADQGAMYKAEGGD